MRLRVISPALAVADLADRRPTTNFSTARIRGTGEAPPRSIRLRTTSTAASWLHWRTQGSPPSHSRQIPGVGPGSTPMTRALGIPFLTADFGTGVSPPRFSRFALPEWVGGDLLPDYPFESAGSK